MLEICKLNRLKFGLMSVRFSKLLLLLVLAPCFGLALGQSNDQSAPTKKQQIPPSDPLPRSDQDQREAPPISPNESSSKQTQIDISPPKDDAAKHPDSDVSDVTEMHTWNPHKAEKDVEVGEFYMKRQNYRAAEDRFREALVYKPGDAIATYRLAEVLNAQGKSAEACKEYEAYLKIPSSGKFNSEAKKAIAKLEQQNPELKQQ